VTTTFPVLNREIARMKDILANGLNPAYDDFNDFLFDYYADFSWTPSESLTQMDRLLSNPEWLALAFQINVKHGFDFRAELTLAVEDRETV
jgi:hypothetical protein